MRKNTLLFAVLLAALLMTACGPTATPTPDTVIEGTTTASIYEGKLYPVNSMEQSFGVPGQVAEILVQDGEQVEVGQVLARLAVPVEVELTHARAQLELQSAQQALNNLMESAELNLAQQRVAVFAAQDQVDAAQERLDEEETDENQAALDAALALLEQSKATLEKLDSGNGVDPDVMEAAILRLNSAEVSVKAVQATLESYELKAVLAGTVVDSTLQVGQRVAAGQVIFSLADFSQWVVKTDNLTEIDVASVELGEPVDIYFDALPEITLTGKVANINMRSEEKRGDTTYTVKVLLENSDPRLRWGMTSAVHFEP